MKLSRMCKVNYTAQTTVSNRRTDLVSVLLASECGELYLTVNPGGRYCGVIAFTLMPTPDSPSPKRQALQASGTFNPRHAQVRHPLFQNSEFFDPQDLLQLKYETVRALEHDQYSIAKAASEFGLSRPTIYQAQENFQNRGVEGLLPGKRGPKQAHKLTAEVLEHVRALLTAQPELKARELAARVRQRFQIQVHPRTIEKALNPKAKKGRQRPG